MTGEGNPMRLVVPFGEWPCRDQAAWRAATIETAEASFTQSPLITALSPASLRKVMGGYGRWLGFLQQHGWLDPRLGPEDRVTPECVAAYFDALREAGNADHTVVGRFAELETALGLMAASADFTWLRRPRGVPLRRLLAMRRRSVAVHHSRSLYEWGLQMMADALAQPGPDRRRVMLRDGLLIALFAARGMRLRSITGLRLGQHVRRDGDGVWRIVLDEEDIKTRRPLEYPVPASLAPWLERYLAVERAELLAGRVDDALWINWTGAPLGERGLEKRIRWWSAKRFGAEGAFGPHRFRHCIGTTGPIADPAAPAASAALLGITAGVHRKHYDRGRRSAAAARFQDNLARLRRETGGMAQRLFAARAANSEESKP